MAFWHFTTTSVLLEQRWLMTDDSRLTLLTSPTSVIIIFYHPDVVKSDYILN